MQDKMFEPFSPFQEKTLCTFVQEACQAKPKRRINQAVISEILHLFSQNLPDAPQTLTWTSPVLPRRCVEQLFNIYNVWSANRWMVLGADNG